MMILIGHRILQSTVYDGRLFSRKRQLQTPLPSLCTFFSLAAIVQLTLGKGCFVCTSEQTLHLGAGIRTVTGCCGLYFLGNKIRVLIFRLPAVYIRVEKRINPYPANVENMVRYIQSKTQL